MIEGLLSDLEVVRKDFPILARVLADGAPLVYLDSANTSQKPQVVIDTMVDHLERHNANIARAMHQLGAEATAAYEDARDKVARFLGAPDREHVSRPGPYLTGLEHRRPPTCRRLSRMRSPRWLAAGSARP